MATAQCATAGTIYVDLGRNGNQSAGNINNLGHANSGGFPLVTAPETLNLIDDAGDPTGISITYMAPGSYAGTGADFGGPYPASLSAFPTEALMDSVFIRNDTTTMTLEGLDPSMAYEFTFYGARGGTTGGAAIFTVTGGNGPFVATIGQVLGNETDVQTISGVLADGMNKATISYESGLAVGATVDDNTTRAAAWNVLVITSSPIPEPSCILLLACSTVGLAAVRRR